MPFNITNESVIFKSSFRFIYFMSLFCIHICLCIVCLPSVQEGSEEGAETLELELDMAVRH